MQIDSNSDGNKRLKCIWIDERSISKNKKSNQNYKIQLISLPILFLDTAPCNMRKGMCIGVYIYIWPIV